MYDDQRTASQSRFRFSLATAMFGLTAASVVFGALYGSLMLVGLAFMEGCLTMLVVAAALQAVHEVRTGRPSHIDVAICVFLVILAVAVGGCLAAIGIPML